MPDLVCDGTQFSCTLCTSKLKLSVTGCKKNAGHKPLANMGNCFFPPPGGMCNMTSPPTPCVPAAMPVTPGQKPVKVDGLPALGTSCKFQCARGGSIQVASSGQTVAKHP